ncbi:MAG: tryptophan halogenase, putative [uncultured Lysobacter sp.]|uniref:Tryptophan halogenase, putative n=1 Tax=uncultured Lysobacter sp. TaxID=271060 RepID=A0A6J4K9J7_9GAMM|nr:MAG: tryptophan halogenase, putative [uncultured Lysobacter sp.]
MIVGGGTAGWLTAGVIAAEHRGASPDGLRVTVIESPDVPTIGVGEGTWPTMRDTLRRIGVAEADFIRECDASFKQGSQFRRWVDGGADDHYFHPFVLPQGYTEVDLVAAWRARDSAPAFAELVSVQPHLCNRGKAPKQFATPEYAAVANYAYHLDAGRFGAFLQRHCTGRLGVQHIADHVVAIRSHDNGDIAAVQLKEHGAVAGDLFIDCTGMKSLLLGGHLGVPFVSQKHVLFCDTALAVQVPYSTADTPIVPHTVSTAQSSGWVWDIGLPTRRGIGHVYSSAHTSDDAAERELLRYIAGSVGPDDIPAPRKLSFQPGYRQTFWQRNCVAVGLSAGFIEPLEASAIAMVELSANWISDQLPADREDMDRVARRFNDAFSYRWSRVIDFLKLHYVLTRRTDSAFWRDNVQPESIPGRLSEQLARWRHRPPSRYDFERVEEVFPSASYQYVLYGMGFEPAANVTTRRSDSLQAAEGYFREAAQLTAKMLAALPDHRALINHIHRHGLPRI